MEVKYKGFTVRDDGTVINKFGREIGKGKNDKGYSYVHVDGKNVLKHRFIWEAFNGKIPENLEIDHIIPLSENGGNELSNLRLVTSLDNKHNPRTIEKYKLSNKGKISQKLISTINKRKKTVYQLSINGELINVWESTAECGRNGFNQGNVSMCCNGKLKSYKGFKWSNSLN